MMSVLGQRRVIRALLVVGLAFLPAIALAGPSHAEVAVIEARAPLEDSSEAGVNAAVRDSLDFALREARGRGFQWFWPLSALLTNYAGLQILAATGPIDREEAEEDSGPGMPAPVTTKYDL